MIAISGQLSPDNPLLDQLSADLIEDDDNQTVIDFDYAEDSQGLDDLKQIEKVIINGSQDKSPHKTEESDQEIVANCHDDLLLGSQLMAKKRKKDETCSNETKDNIHKECKQDIEKEKDMRVQMEIELELERQQRIQFQKQLEEHMSFALRKEFDDSKQIKTLKMELLKCKQELERLKKSVDINEELNDVDSNKPNDKFLSCFDCNQVMKSEVSLILHLINHCIEEEEFKLETNTFRLDEFTDSMVDSIRKSVSYCCPRCNLNFNCLEVYYHLYKCHTKEKALKCNICSVYCTHLDYWQQHNQEMHSGRLQTLSYVDIATLRQQSSAVQDKVNTRSLPNGTVGTTRSNSYKGYTTRKATAPSYSMAARDRARPKDSSSDSSDSSDTPEVINLTDSPPPQIAVPAYRPPYSKSTLAVKVNEFCCDFPDCDFKTNSKDKLEFHTSAHTNSKFKCPYCPYVGNILNDIIRHIQKSKKHDGLKVYECRQCSYGSNCLSSFKEHLTRKHFDDSDEDEDVDQYITDLFRNEHSNNGHNK